MHGDGKRCVSQAISAPVPPVFESCVPALPCLASPPATAVPLSSPLSTDAGSIMRSDPLLLFSNWRGPFHLRSVHVSSSNRR
jgi:hypothetical protein